MVTVFNVGQGDAFLLKSDSSCALNDHPLVIDTGKSNSSIAKRLNSEGVSHCSVIITHSHDDHIGGLPALLHSSKVKVDTVFIPFYLPEITAIFEFLKKHIQTKCSTPNWLTIKNAHQCILVSQGDYLCDHASILNPPKNASEFDFGTPTPEYGIGRALEILSNLGLDLSNNQIEGYTPPFGGGLNDEAYFEEGSYRDQARLFVYKFFITLSQALSANPRDSLEYYTTRHFEHIANQASIILKYKCGEEDWLFTGDADETVFNRLITEGVDISAKFLKVPHHGSSENLTKSTLHKINPDYAVISHGNRQFGRSKDTHPHHEVIDLLDRHGATTFYTNPVEKGKPKVQIKAGANGEPIAGKLKFA